MQKNKIKFENENEFLEALSYDGNSEFEFVEQTESEFDKEKGSILLKTVVRRKSDNKFFRGEFHRFPAGLNSVVDATLVEVFPKIQQVTVYE